MDWDIGASSVRVKPASANVGISVRARRQHVAHSGNKLYGHMNTNLNASMMIPAFSRTEVIGVAPVFVQKLLFSKLSQSTFSLLEDQEFALFSTVLLARQPLVLRR